MTKYNNLRSERVMDALAEYIDKTGLQPGDTVPSERMLSEMWQVSRGTVREALGRMCREGILIPMQGKGTYVAPEKEHIEMKTMISFSEAFSGKGEARKQSPFAETGRGGRVSGEDPAHDSGRESPCSEPGTGDRREKTAA